MNEFNSVQLNSITVYRCVESTAKWPVTETAEHVNIIIIIIIIRYVYLLSQAFLPGTSLEPAVIPTTHASSFTLQYFPYYV